MTEGSIFDRVVRREPSEHLRRCHWAKLKWSWVWTLIYLEEKHFRKMEQPVQSPEAGGCLGWCGYSRVNKGYKMWLEVWAGLESRRALSAMVIILFLVKWEPFECLEQSKHDLNYVFKGHSSCCAEKRWGRVWRHEEGPTGCFRLWLLPTRWCWEI